MSTPNSLIQILIFCNFFLISQSTDTNTNFTFHGFNDTNLDLQGATITKPSGALRLTNTSNFVIGHAFYPFPIPLFNFSFTTQFIFQINPASTANRGGYGLAFTLSPSPGFPGAAAGQLMGVFNESNDGNSSNHVFMVEFDTVNGYNEKSDSDGNHVAINLNGMNSSSSKPASYLPEGSRDNEEEVYLQNHGPVQAWIDYDGIVKHVNVTVAPLGVDKPNKPLLSLDLDEESDVLLPNMYAGFSAATGEKSSSHYILGWSFCLNGIANQLNASLLPTVKVVKASSSNSSKVRTALIATFSVVLVVLVVFLIAMIFYRRAMRFDILEDWEVDAPHRFRYKVLYTATKGFRESEKIGEGGFGAVYRGVLPTTGGEIAVKKIMSNNSLKGMREFAAEIESLGKLRQKNLVNLQGWCKYKNELLIVYDYVPNGSLDSLLFNSSTVLSWEQRFNIIKGVASGLLYLHEEWEQVVIHRDVKSSNVLIDRDMNPRLGDFGLARLYDHGKNSHTTNVVGTIGYIAPELYKNGQASTSTDVFAYGILLLEIACGRAAVMCESHRNVILVDWVVECMQMRNIFEAVDAKLNSAYVVEEMELVLGLGLLCSHPKAESRPTMRQVTKYLNGDEVLPLFERLSSAGSRRADEVTARLLELGLSDRYSNTTFNYVLLSFKIDFR
ncbi:LOW QUALITY PROTEIN: lectin-domain containing receptor kinase VI.4-like [Salvia miltiorrhiza]|uniref:LOW QUALITY PROTEIN: lectin-domain containing receptor kinase VI.4-like n=1 Tax=Salvia miltiorrhiza TaxID=226208 RepID=UPI0025ABAB20|nr:LOW QUALITY PROTEIN: lectin-domain containing receptor kinase VI.4-like [Salvia miltiorrhiza]